MTTAKKVILAAGVGVGAFLLYRLARPSAAPRRGVRSTAATVNSSGDIVSGLVAPFASLANLFAGPTSYGAAASGSGASWAGGNNYRPSTAADFAAAESNYGYADTHPGAALPDGVYGPAVPSSSESVSTGDDGLVWA